MDKNREREKLLNFFSNFLTLPYPLSPLPLETLSSSLFLSPNPFFSDQPCVRRGTHDQARNLATLTSSWFGQERCRTAWKEPREPPHFFTSVTAPITPPPPLTPFSSRTVRGAPRRVDLRRKAFKDRCTKTTTPNPLHLLRELPPSHGQATNCLGWPL